MLENEAQDVRELFVETRRNLRRSLLLMQEKWLSSSPQFSLSKVFTSSPSSSLTTSSLMSSPFLFAPEKSHTNQTFSSAASWPSTADREKESNKKSGSVACRPRHCFSALQRAIFRMEHFPSTVASLHSIASFANYVAMASDIVSRIEKEAVQPSAVIKKQRDLRGTRWALTKRVIPLLEKPASLSNSSTPTANGKGQRGMAENAVEEASREPVGTSLHSSLFLPSVQDNSAYTAEWLWSHSEEECGVHDREDGSIHETDEVKGEAVRSLLLTACVCVDAKYAAPRASSIVNALFSSMKEQDNAPSLSSSDVCECTSTPSAIEKDWWLEYEKGLVFLLDESRKTEQKDMLDAPHSLLGVLSCSSVKRYWSTLFFDGPSISECKDSRTSSVSPFCVSSSTALKLREYLDVSLRVGVLLFPSILSGFVPRLFTNRRKEEESGAKCNTLPPLFLRSISFYSSMLLPVFIYAEESTFHACCAVFIRQVVVAVQGILQPLLSCMQSAKAMGRRGSEMQCAPLLFVVFRLRELMDTVLGGLERSTTVADSAASADYWTVLQQEFHTQRCGSSSAKSTPLVYPPMHVITHLGAPSGLSKALYVYLVQPCCAAWQQELFSLSSASRSLSSEDASMHQVMTLIGVTLRTAMYRLWMVLECIGRAELSRFGMAEHRANATRKRHQHLLQQADGKITVPLLHSLAEEQQLLMDELSSRAPSGHKLYRLHRGVDEMAPEKLSSISNKGGKEVSVYLYVESGSIYFKVGRRALNFQLAKSIAEIFKPFAS